LGLYLLKGDTFDVLLNEIDCGVGLLRVLLNPCELVGYDFIDEGLIKVFLGEFPEELVGSWLTNVFPLELK
jgi:hypothetical protein